MPVFRGTFFFQSSTRPFGWTETYALTVADYDAAEIELALLADLRVAILTTDCVIRAVRMSNTSVAGDARFIGIGGDVGTLAGDFVDPTTALLTRYEATPVYRGRTFLHGVVQDVFTAALGYDHGNPAAADFTAFGVKLASTPFQIRTVAGVLITWRNIDNVQFVGYSSHRVGRPFGLQRGRRKIPA